MDTTQLAQTVNWLDEQHRRDRAEITRLQQRLEAAGNEVQEQARRLKELEARLTSTQAQLSRFTQIEQALQNLKNEVTIMVNNQADELSRAQRDLEQARMTDREMMSRGLAETRKELTRLRPMEEEIGVRKVEDQRLNEFTLALRQEIVETRKDIEERTRGIPYLTEQRTHDNKRIGQLQQENVELFKRLEEAASKLQMLEQKQQKTESQALALAPIVDNMKRGQEQFIESLKLADADRQRQMRDWRQVFETQQKSIDEHRQRLLEFAAAYEEAKRAVSALEKFEERIQREQNQVAELQRLAEERQRKEWETYTADNEKRVKKQALEWDYRWDQQVKINATLADRFLPLEQQLALHADVITFYWRFVEAQSASQLTAAQKWLAEVQQLATQRQNILKKHEEAKLESR